MKTRRSRRKGNQEVVNATPTTYDGIKFKSKLEVSIYKELVKLGFRPEYEKTVLVLMKGFSPCKPWLLDGEPQVLKPKNKKDSSLRTKKLQDWTYTPDFRIEYGGLSLFIEVKGRPNQQYPLKRKMCIKLFENYPDYYFLEVRSVQGLHRSLEFIKTKILCH